MDLYVNSICLKVKREKGRHMEGDTAEGRRRERGGGKESFAEKERSFLTLNAPRSPLPKKGLLFKENMHDVVSTALATIRL